MKISVQTLDRKIWRKDLVTEFLYKCYLENTPAEIDFGPEGSCAEFLGMYRLLDEFCDRTGYSKSMITIITANMVEEHTEYNIVKNPYYWYEISEIQNWLNGKVIETGTVPSKHFANFSSRSNWARLWIATILDSKYPEYTLQTYHYDPVRENYNYNGYIGVDDLFKYGCNLIPEAVKFLQTCPRTLDIEFLKNLDNCKDSLFQHQNSYYPIQHPSNLNLLQYYSDIFVDIVVEPNVSGNCFLVTEKLWRPIIARRPFIVMSNHYYLRNLKKLGFKTFDKWWSEEYDYYSMQDRIKLIDKLLTDITALKTNNTLVEMQEVLDYNYNRFIELTYNNLIEEFINV